MRKIVFVLCLLFSGFANSQCDTVTNLNIVSITPNGGTATFTLPPSYTTFSWAIFTHPANVFTGVQGITASNSISFVGLNPSTQYRFQIATIGSCGTSTGANKTFSTTAAQVVYTPMTAAGYSFKYLKVDSLLHLSVGDTSLKRADTRAGAIVYKNSDSLFYGYDGLRWKSLGGNINTLTNLINSKIDTIYKNIDTIFYKKNSIVYGFVLDTANSSRNGILSKFDYVKFNNKSDLDSIRLVNTGILHTPTASFLLSNRTGVVTQTLATQNPFSFFGTGSTSATPIFRRLFNSTLTTGRIPFVGSNGAFSESANLFFDSTGNRFSINNPTLTSGVSLTARGNSTADLFHLRTSADALAFSISSVGHVNMGNQTFVRWGNFNTRIEGNGNGIADYMRFRTNGVDRIAIVHNGNVGINTNSPAFNLDVQGTVNITGKITQPTTANSPSGFATLVNGVVTVNNTLATTGCIIRIEYRSGTALSTTSSILVATSVVNNTSFTITAYNAGAATTNTSDNNQIQYTIYN